MLSNLHFRHNTSSKQSQSGTECYVSPRNTTVAFCSLNQWIKKCFWTKWLSEWSNYILHSHKESVVHSWKNYSVWTNQLSELFQSHIDKYIHLLTYLCNVQNESLKKSPSIMNRLKKMQTQTSGVTETMKIQQPLEADRADRNPITPQSAPHVVQV